MGILDDLLGAYSTAWNQMTPDVKAGGGSTKSNLLDALSASQTGYIPPTQTGDQIAANPQVVQISPQEAAAAQAQQAQAPAQPQVDPARVAAMQAAAAQAQQQAPAQAATPTVAQPPQAPDPTQQVTPPPVASVNAQPGFPSPSDYNADGTQATDPSAQSSGGGLLGALAGAGQEAAQDPVKAKGLLSQLGDTASQIGDKLKNLSPAASQALIASGLTMLASNDGQHNLSQIVGQGGIAGVNQYQTITQNQIANRIAQQKLAQDLAEKQATNATANYNAATERFKATNQPVVSDPGQVVNTVGGLANGQSGTPITGPGGELPAKTTREVQGPDGTTYTQAYDMWGRPVGAPTVKSAPYTGELNAADQKTVNDANTQANNSALALTKTQNFMKQLTPTIPDPNNPGQTIPNPDYVPVTGGVAATVQNELNKITGGQTQSTMLRQQIQQDVYHAQLGNWKAGVGGRLTNTDVNLLKQGMPPDNASGSALLQYLQAYSHLQEDQATHDALSAQYTTANRGDSSPLHKDSVIGGTTYPAGTTMAQVLSKQAPVQSSQSNVSAQQAQGYIAQAQAAARGGDAKAQAALKQRGLSW
jgi:hypothetical protein